MDSLASPERYLNRPARMLKAIERTELRILDDLGLSVLTSSERRDLPEILEDLHRTCPENLESTN